MSGCFNALRARCVIDTRGQNRFIAVLVETASPRAGGGWMAIGEVWLVCGWALCKMTG